MTEKKLFTLEGIDEEICQVYCDGICMGTDEVVDLLNEQEEEIKRLKLVVHEVIDAIIDDARVQLNEEFLEYADKFDSIDDLQNEIKKNLYDGDD